MQLGQKVWNASSRPLSYFHCTNCRNWRQTLQQVKDFSPAATIFKYRLTRPHHDYKRMTLDGKKKKSDYTCSHRNKKSLREAMWVITPIFLSCKTVLKILEVGNVQECVMRAKQLHKNLHKIQNVRFLKKQAKHKHMKLFKCYSASQPMLKVTTQRDSNRQTNIWAIYRHWKTIYNAAQLLIYNSPRPHGATSKAHFLCIPLCPTS